jgi:sulfoxide reductase heme-binding subunit YedZ
VAIDSQVLFNNPYLNQWRLFFVGSAIISLSTLLTMVQLDLSSAETISYMIQYTVRWAVPFLFLVFMASSLQVIRPSLFSRWLARNRKFLGLCFASAMAWQGLFILWLANVHSDYYAEEVYNLSDSIEGLGGYLFLFAMVATSFKFGRSRLTPKQWRNLHKVGIYYLWAYAWSVYWYALYYYGSPETIDYVFYWFGFVAWGTRMLAWSKKEQRKVANKVKTNLKSSV